MPRYLAAFEIDQRQRIINQADKLREMVGGSWTIEETVRAAKKILATHRRVKLILPVSGSLWFVTLGESDEDAQDLREALWELREKFVTECNQAATFGVLAVGNNFTDAAKELEKLTRKLKDAKYGEVGEAALPQMASCQIEREAFANVWHPAKWDDLDQRRRSLISTDSERRLRVGEKVLRQRLDTFKSYKEGSFQEPHEFEDLVESESDSYIALVKADGDGMGRLFGSLDWNRLAETLAFDETEWCRIGNELGWHQETLVGRKQLLPEEATACFSLAVTECLRQALSEAGDWVAKGTERVKDKKPFFPVVPIVAAGEDFWVLCKRTAALPFALEFSRRYAELAAQHRVLRTAIETAGLAGREALTLSVGILFAHQGHPFELQRELGEELLKSAKKLRKTEHAQEGCLDSLWLASTARESLDQIRQRGWEYHDAGKQYWLHTRPWKTTEFAAVLEAVGKLKSARIARRKWHQLELVLRLGGLSELAWLAWRNHLDEAALQSLDEALVSLPQRFRLAAPAETPWHSNDAKTSCSTPLLDLVECMEIGELPSAQDGEVAMEQTA